MDQPGKVANPAGGQLNREKFPCPRSCLKFLVSRDRFGRPVPRQPDHCPHSGLVLCSLAGLFPLPATASNFTPSTAIGSVPSYQVMQLRNDGVHCRESPGTGPVFLKIVPVTGAAFSGIAMDQFWFASLFSPQLLVCITVLITVDIMMLMCDTKSVGGVYAYFCYFMVITY